MRVSARVARGPQKGKTLTPHLHEDGLYVLSPTRFSKDYIRVKSLDEFAEGLRKGLSGRMSSNSAKGPRLVSPSSILIEE